MGCFSSSVRHGSLCRDSFLLLLCILVWLVVLLSIIKGMKTDIDCPQLKNCSYIETNNTNYDIYVEGKYICSSNLSFTPVNGTICYLEIDNIIKWCDVSITCDKFSRELLKYVLLLIFSIIPSFALMYSTIRICIRWRNWRKETRIYEQGREDGSDGELLAANSDE